MNLFLSLSAATLITMTSGVAQANEVLNVYRPDKENTVFMAPGWDSVPRMTLGYGRSLPIKQIDRAVLATVGFEIPLSDGLDHYRADVASLIAIFEGKWNVANRFALGLHRTENPLYSGTALGFEEGILAGYFDTKWFVASEFTYERLALMRISHSATYKENPYGDANDGWHGSTEGKFAVGAQGGYRFLESYEISLRIVTAPYGVPPIVANLGASYHF